MTTPAADDFEAIRRRLEELAAEKNLALTGSTTKPTENEYLGEAAIGWPYVAYSTSGTESVTLAASDLPPYTPSALNELARELMRMDADSRLLASIPKFCALVEEKLNLTKS